MRNLAFFALVCFFSVTVFAQSEVKNSVWAPVEKAIAEQKMQSALDQTEAILKNARIQNDSQLITQALIRATQLRISLHGYETAVRFLKDEEWPKEATYRILLHLYYGSSLMFYEQMYGYEIATREKTVSAEKVDLKAWTREQIGKEISKSFDLAINEAGDFNKAPPDFFKPYLNGGNYPKDVRPTLRDSIVYLAVSHLAAKHYWTPDQMNEVYKLNVNQLSSNPPLKRIAAGDPSAHPIEKIASWLGEHAQFHLQNNRVGAFLEARYNIISNLHSLVTEKADRTNILDKLKQLQLKYQEQEWWARGQALVAQLIQSEETPGKLIEALKEAKRGQNAYPKSIGGQQCASIAFQIEAPNFSLTSMTNDAAKKRSVLIEYKNFTKIFFRAYPIETPDERLTRRRQSDANRVIESKKPIAEWEMVLPQTVDFEDHRAFASLPVLKNGSYLVAASMRPDFLGKDTITQAVEINITDIVMITRNIQNSSYEVRTLSGQSGVPLKGVAVSLYRHNWQSPPTSMQTVLTDAEGYAVFKEPAKNASDYWTYFFVAKLNDQIATSSQVYFQPSYPEAEILRSFVYTDRSIYRPDQKLFFKVIAYKGKSGQFTTAPNAQAIKMALVDPNNQTVQEKEIKLGEFGSGAGEFVIPSGRPLGQWRVQATGFNGSASIRVEEYKRPTFEPSIKEATQPLRLNKKAHLEGEAKYYFGLPVSSGSVKWQVTREEVIPWFWHFWGWYFAESSGGPQTIAHGTSAISANGSFSIDFTPEADEREASRPGLTYSYHVHAEVKDEGGETRETSRDFRVGFVSVEAKIDLDKGFYQADQLQEIPTLLTNLNGTPRKGKASYKILRVAQPDTVLPAELPRNQGSAVRSHRVRGSTSGHSTSDEYSTPDDRKRARWETDFVPEAVTHSWRDGDAVASGVLNHDEKGAALIKFKTPFQSGVYRIVYETVDDFGAKFKVSRDFFIANDSSKISLPLLMLAEKQVVLVGNKARLFVHSGLDNQPLTLETFRSGKRISRRMLISKKEKELIEIPIRLEDRGGFTVTVSGVRDHQSFKSEVNIQVPWKDRELKLEFATFRDRLRPGEHETFQISVKNDQGVLLDAGSAEVLGYMYDRSLDLFGPHQYPVVTSIYPSKMGAAGDAISLGSAGGMFVHSSMPSGPVPPYLVGDRLAFEARYGIGGPGRRGGFAAEDAMMSDAAPMEMAKAPASAPARAMGQLGVEKSLQAASSLAGVAARNAEEPSKPAAATETRSNFSETAFFKPNLIIGKGGRAAIEFTAPDSVTSWTVFAHAITKDLRGGLVSKELKTVKELMVRPYAPRFVREGDEAEIKVTVNNASDKTLDGDLSFDIVEIDSGKSVLSDFKLSGERKKKFSVLKNGSTTLAFPIIAPNKVGSYAFYVTASTKDFSDGEKRPFPVLPSRMHLAQSRFVTLKNAVSKTLEFKDLSANTDPSLINEQMVVTVDAQLFYGVLQALPYLIKYPYECAEQTVNRFVSTGIVRSMFEKYPAVAKMAKEFSSRKTQLEKFDDSDPNRRITLEESPWLQEAQGGAKADAPLVNVLDSDIAKRERDDALAKLRKMQLSSGAFPWFQGGPPDEYMTLYLLMSLSRALEFHVDIPKDMVANGWRFTRSWLDGHLETIMNHHCCWEFITMVNFTLSAYPDDSWTGNSFDAAYRKRLLDYSFLHWKEHAPLVKGYLALTLKRSQREADAKLVWDSVMDSAKNTEELGTYWAAEDRSWLWYNDTIETHAFSLRVQMELNQKDKHNEGLVQWLFLNKKLNHWKSTRATAEVVYSLIHYLDKQAQLGTREAVDVVIGNQKTNFVFEPDKYTGKKNQIVIPGEKVDSKTTSKILVSKSTPGFAFASATWHFSTNQMPKEGSGDFFSVSRKYFKREHSGAEWILKPISEGTKISVGDQIEVQISLKTKHEAEYVHLRDPRGAGFEPETLNSGYKYDLGIFWYEETRDSGSNFFFSKLPVGEYTFKYKLRANMAGQFRVGPATVQSIYAPEFNAYSAGDVLKVSQK